MNKTPEKNDLDVAQRWEIPDDHSNKTVEEFLEKHENYLNNPDEDDEILQIHQEWKAGNSQSNKDQVESTLELLPQPRKDSDVDEVYQSVLDRFREDFADVLKEATQEDNSTNLLRGLIYEADGRRSSDTRISIPDSFFPDENNDKDNDKTFLINKKYTTKIIPKELHDAEIAKRNQTEESSACLRKRGSIKSDADTDLENPVKEEEMDSRITCKKCKYVKAHRDKIKVRPENKSNRIINWISSSLYSMLYNGPTANIESDLYVVQPTYFYQAHEKCPHIKETPNVSNGPNSSVG